MKIRTITLGIPIRRFGRLKKALAEEGRIAEFLKEGLEREGYEVQTIRAATEPFEHWIAWETEEELQAKATALAEACEASPFQHVSIGPACPTLKAISAVPVILKIAKQVSLSVGFKTSETGIKAKLEAVVETINKIANEPGTAGLDNFRFCAAFACKPGIPFFPAAHHDPLEAFITIHAIQEKPMTAYIGLENSDVVVNAFLGAADLEEASQRFLESYTAVLLPLENVMKRLCGEAPSLCDYGGIDTSINPSLDPKESLVRAYEAIIGEERFGRAGSLAVSEALTRLAQSVPIKMTGYKGLMLPVMEDVGLAERASQGTYNISELLTFSSVCGVGLDTVPISSTESPEKVVALLYDIMALSKKYDKQLSCRLFPAAGQAAGEQTRFESPYLCNTKIFRID